MRGERRVGPRIAVVPVPSITDAFVQAAVVVGGDGIATNEADSWIGRVERAQLSRRAQLEVRAHYVDGPAQCDFSFSRWRAAFARLPHVAMSHQRRRPFFVLSKNTR